MSCRVYYFPVASPYWAEFDSVVACDCDRDERCSWKKQTELSGPEKQLSEAAPHIAHKRVGIGCSVWAICIFGSGECLRIAHVKIDLVSHLVSLERLG